MTVSRAPPRLRLVLRPSAVLVALLAVAHCVAAVALGIALPGGLLDALAAALLAIHGGWAVHCHGLLRAKRSVVWLELCEEDRCVVGRGSGAMLTCRIGVDSYVTPALVVLHLAPQPRGRAIFVVLLPDSSSPDALRRLRARLRLMKTFSSTGSEQDARL